MKKVLARTLGLNTHINLNGNIYIANQRPTAAAQKILVLLKCQHTEGKVSKIEALDLNAEVDVLTNDEYQKHLETEHAEVRK